MAIQTTYSQTMDAARAGQVATLTAHTIISGNVETAAGIGFGKAVVFGANDGGVKLPTANGEIFRGITVRTNSAKVVTTDDADKYTQNTECAIITKGEVWVEVEANVTDGQAVYFDELDGEFTGTSGSGKVEIPNARFVTTAQANNLAKVLLG